MKTKTRLLQVLSVLALITGTLLLPHMLIAEEDALPATAVDTVVGPSIGNFWDLTKHAGGFRWLIFLVLVVGVFLITMKIYELTVDRLKARQFERTNLQKLDKKRITDLISRQSDHILSRLAATLINVFQTSRNADSLHDEIANYVQFQHDKFTTFRTRIDFLSDTAGALGLLGTVWGMFIVFFSGNLDKQVILTGMGIALLTTLLGLIVSIFLNFFSTVASGIYNKRLDQVIKKSDELRFRLLEINEMNGYEKRMNPRNESVLKGNGHKNIVEKQASEKDVLSSYSGDGKKEQMLKNENFGTSKKMSDFIPKTENTVFSTKGTAGSNNNGNGHTMISDTFDVTRFNRMPEHHADKPIREEHASSEDVSTLSSSTPTAVNLYQLHLCKEKGNNQIGQTGKVLPEPFIVEVHDESGSAVDHCNVHFEVQRGNGTFPNGSKSATVHTDEDGVAKIRFTLDIKPGFNIVTAKLSDANKHVRFQAVGQEVTG